MTMNRNLAKAAVTAALLCPVVGVVALLSADGAANWSGNLSAVEVEDTATGGPTVYPPTPVDLPTLPPEPTPTLYPPTPADPPFTPATVYPPTPANPLNTPTLHRPVPANPLKTPILYPPFPTVGPVAGEPACESKLYMACAEVGK